MGTGENDLLFLFGRGIDDGYGLLSELPIHNQKRPKYEIAPFTKSYCSYADALAQIVPFFVFDNTFPNQATVWSDVE